MKKILLSTGRAILPKPTRTWLIKLAKDALNSKLGRVLDLKFSFRYDRKRFSANSSAISGPNSREKMRAIITMDYHRIEKGLSLSTIKRSFGESVVDRLLKNCREYLRLYGSDQVVLTVINTLSAYEQFRNNTDLMPSALAKSFKQLKSLVTEMSSSFQGGGTIEFSRDQLDPSAHEYFTRLSMTRHSIRNFTGETVDPEIIDNAVALASRSPSVCNRQSCGVYAYFEADQKNLALSFQNGNSGFGHLAGAVLIVVSDIRNFTSSAERSQCWIDGGMFAMSLVYALHSSGLGTCCLNWSATVAEDRQLRAGMKLKNEDSVITMLAVGHIPDRIRVASSPRLPLSELIRNKADSDVKA